LGLNPTTVAELRGGDAQANADVAMSLLDGSEQGPIRETVLLNAAAALVADGTLPGTSPADGNLVNRLRAGYELAAASIDEGKALDALRRWQTASVTD
jgi:anthranilate phosphoribosyltransferase